MTLLPSTLLPSTLLPSALLPSYTFAILSGGGNLPIWTSRTHPMYIPPWRSKLASYLPLAKKPRSLLDGKSVRWQKCGWQKCNNPLYSPACQVCPLFDSLLGIVGGHYGIWLPPHFNQNFIRNSKTPSNLGYLKNCSRGGRFLTRGKIWKILII